MSFHAHQRGVVLGCQHGPAFDDDCGRLRSLSAHLEDRVRQNRLSRRDRRKPRDLDDGARAEALRLFGFHPDGPGAIVHVEHVADEPEPRGAREVAQLDRVPRDVTRHDALYADAPVDFARGRVVVDAAHRPSGQRERIRRRLQHDDIARVPHEERHPAKLLAAAEERADIPAQLHARVDEARQIFGSVVPERRAHDALLECDIGKERQHLWIGGEPCPHDHANDLDVVAVVPPRDHRPVGDSFGLR